MAKVVASHSGRRAVRVSYACSPGPSWKLSTALKALYGEPGEVLARTISTTSRPRAASAAPSSAARRMSAAVKGGLISQPPGRAASASSGAANTSPRLPNGASTSLNRL